MNKLSEIIFFIKQKRKILAAFFLTRDEKPESTRTNLLNQGSEAFTYDLIKAVHLSKGKTPSPNQIEEFIKEINSNPQYLDRFLTEIFDLMGKKVIAVSTSDETLT